MEQISMFDLLMPTFKIDKPIRLIEFFAGYGSQALALKYLGAKFEHYKICEWAINSIIAYASLHRNELPYYGENFCGDLTKEQIANELFNYGVSADYNKPATIEQLKRMSEEKLRLCYNSIWWTNNLVDISRTKGKELNIVETDKFTYLLTYSFPCQDLSLAGKGKGMEKGSGTRSGLLWEVERILSECDVKPQVLVMENVTQVHGAGNEEHFKQWMLRLEELGYQSYWNDMSATEYGIPQTRNRTFMVSILGDYNYKFPKKTKLKLRLKDLLENNVDEKYYLSDKLVNFFMYNEMKQKEKGNGFKFNVTDGNDTAKTITTRSGSRMDDNFIGNKTLKETLEKIDLDKVDDVTFLDCYNRNAKNDGTAITVTTRFDASNNNYLLIKNATAKGFLEAEDGDGIDISSRMESHRGTVQKNKAQTLTTAGGAERGVVVKENIPNKVNKIGNYSPSGHNASAIVDVGGLAPTVMENHGTVTAILEEKNEK